MSRAARLAMLSVTATVAVLVILWKVFVSAPPPQEVCDHMVEVTVAQAAAQGMSAQSEAQVIERMRATCIKHKQDKLQLRGRIAYAQHAKCIMAAATLADVDRC